MPGADKFAMADRHRFLAACYYSLGVSHQLAHRVLRDLGHLRALVGLFYNENAKQRLNRANDVPLMG